MADDSVVAAADRYARQRLIAGWQHHHIQGATVLVAGVGALGNEVLKNLALLGVGHLLMVDMDCIAASNLSRTILFQADTVGQSKAETAAHAVKRINPDVRATALHGDLRYVLGLGRLHRCDLVLGCLDNQGARSFLSRMCLAAGVPLLDAGMWALGGEVRAFLTADDACFDCLLAPAERTDLWLRYSCTGGFRPTEDEPPQATTITTTAIVAGLLSQDAAQFLQGSPPAHGTALVYNGQAGKLYRTTLRRDPRCPNHAPFDWSGIQSFNGTAHTITARAILNQAASDLGATPTLDLGRDLLLAFACPTCQSTEQVMQPQGLVAASRALCPVCATERIPRTISTVTATDPWADEPLARLGVPDGDVVRTRAGDQVMLYELIADDEQAMVAGANA